jgi:carboxyl-terminal processing protease
MTRAVRIFLIVAALLVTNALTFVGGVVLGQGLGRYGGLSDLFGPFTAPAAAGTPSELEVMFRPFWQAWDIVHRDFADQPVDDAALMQGAIRGMLQALGDPHTAYLTPEEAELASTYLDGELEGIGALVETSGDRARIVSPLPGSPAEAAGLLPGDLILTIDGDDIADQTLVTIVGKVRGPAGSVVILEIEREGEPEPLTFTIVRAKIIIPSVESRMLESGVGYVKINDFGEKTDSELRQQLRDLLTQEPRGLVLDLRGNPGGYLTTAIDVASEFIPNGVVMLERFGDGAEKTYRAQSGGVAADLPLVVLIDKGSASASEIVAGAVQDRERGLVVGEPSYGKGSVQIPRQLSGENGGELRVTIARWLTPNGHWIHGEGITPDVVVERTAEDRAAGRDPQLEKAIELLTNP